MMAVQDPIKKSSVEAIRALHEAGMEVMMLTGDNEKQAIAKGAGLDRVRPGITGRQRRKSASCRKAKRRSQWWATALTMHRHWRVPMLAWRSAGTDIAMESADIVLVRSALTDWLQRSI